MELTVMQVLKRLLFIFSHTFLKLQDVRCLLSTHVIQFKIESIHLYYI